MEWTLSIDSTISRVHQHAVGVLSDGELGERLDTRQEGRR
ncbi:hypothetical protein AQF52_0274 [Streptomyces venezuelae]|nr:hypothetical protein AQF52_0274 [Streptomyces venezuelae]